MNKIITVGIVCLISVTSFASSLSEKEATKPSATYQLRTEADSIVLINGFSAVNSTVEFDLLPQNSSAQVGLLLRYVNENNWIYVGCDKATDHFGFAYWYVETPEGKTEIARDISKLYAHYWRHIKVNCVGRTVTVYVDGEQITHQYIPALPLSAGQIGFRVHDKGNVLISNVVYHSVKEPEKVPAEKKSYYTLSSLYMDVLLNKDFPSVYAYRWKKDGSQLDGQPFDIKSVTINGDTYQPVVTAKEEADRILYTLKIKEIAVDLQVCCKVEENVLQLSVTEIKEKGIFRVKTLAFPDHNLVSVSHTTPDACLSVANNVHSDFFYSLKDKAVDSTCQYGSILLLNTDKLVATLESNSIYNTRQFLYWSAQVSGSTVTGIWGNEWIYRGHNGEIVDQPYIKVILADDENQDGKIDWQDGAIALRKEYPKPPGTDMLHNSYATITMNFASCAQYPFLRQLDNIKKFYLATDGFGQMLELKGYQSEGHDSAHPDYSGNYNERAGGKKELAFLAKEARKYNAYIGVHINHSESYPEARAFNDRIVTDMPAWSWLDQAYFINKEADMLAGTFEKRLNQLKADVPDLSFIYIDTYREYRWLAYQTARLFNRNGWAVWTEDADVFDKEAIWIHYNPEAQSLIHRFVHHQYRDGYATHPALLGGYNRGAEIGFMGWQKGRDFNGVIRNFFTKQLPYRYLMHYPVLQLDTVRAVLEDGLIAIGNKDGKTVIKKGEMDLMSGDCVFIPWNPEAEEKIYHYNVQGGKTTWHLPLSWKGQTTVYLYELGSLGRELAGTLPVRNGQIEVEAQPDKGYVIYKREMKPLPEMLWSEGNPVKDTGFDSQSFKNWEVQGAKEALAIKETDYGLHYLEIKGKKTAGVNQVINGLIPGKEYIASAWVNVIGKKEAILTVQSGERLNEQASISESEVMNYTDNTDRFRTTWQRLKVPFRLPEDKTDFVLSLKGGIAADDTAAVCFDDVRIVECPHSRKDGFDYFEDFEHVDEGWGPFIPSQPSAFTTHLSQKHDVYTDNTIHGNWSLVTWREKNGEVYRTSPSMIRFAPEQEYEIEFDYKVDTSSAYRVIGKSLSTGEQVFSYDLNRPGKCNIHFTTPACTDFYIAVVKQGNGLLVIDDFGIKGNKY
ncbi:MAG: endo-alpha-N-acetylgalactosaminidase family protein [Tannerella sp.]|jgi:endo-alpha-N-acetylgalactosaminidase|nr:endo-alpha-N-acetylgalactosaminidase family protein [Tannerella sp.]